MTDRQVELAFLGLYEQHKSNVGATTTLILIQNHIFALADRLAASERELEAIRDTVGDTEFALRQQLASAQATIARLENHVKAMQETVSAETVDLKQQVARLRESLFHMQVCRLCSEEGAWDECEHGRGALQALRETGA